MHLAENSPLNDQKIYVAGHAGMVGSAVVRRLQAAGLGDNILVADKEAANLVDQRQTDELFKRWKPDVVINCAAKVGGIHANNAFRAQFIYENLQMQNNLTHSSHIHGVKTLLFLGSSCIYPKHAKQPITEQCLLSAKLEPTNEPYAIAKIAGIKMCESYYRQYGSNFISVMPCNQYGPNDNFHPDNAHVLPALMKRFHDAKSNKEKSVTVWGTGQAMREFMYVDDLADACIFILENSSAKDIYPLGISHLNIGTGSEVSIASLAHIISDVTKYEGEIKFDSTKPDGTLKKLMDSSRLIGAGWKPKVSLFDGLRKTYEWYLAQTEIRQK